jgi:hypothetical protein
MTHKDPNLDLVKEKVRLSHIETDDLSRLILASRQAIAESRAFLEKSRKVRRPFWRPLDPKARSAPPT